jgi:hypothetical protein
MKRIILAALLLLVPFVGSGCMTCKPMKEMKCGKCACKKMVEDPANPGKCKMCGHSAAEHSAGEAAKPGEVDHSAHH